MKTTTLIALQLTRKEMTKCLRIFAVAVISLSSVWFSGCHHNQNITFYSDAEPCQNYLQSIDYPSLQDEVSTDGTDLITEAPMTISGFQELQPVMITIDECVHLALSNSKILQKLGGTVVNAPQAATTLVDQAIIETNPQQSVEAALSAFDARVTNNLLFTHIEPPNVGATALFGSSKTDGAIHNFDLSKTTATGATYSFANNINYQRLGTLNPFTPFRSDYDWESILRVRQPLGRGSGLRINRIAGPNSAPGVYNGVVIARLRSDISLADFESSVRNLVRDVENNYWELFFAYRDLATNLSARDAARETWENRKLRLENGVGRPDDEALARQQYFNFDIQVQSALTGVLNGQPGVLGAERNLRRLLGLPVNTAEILKPATDPTTAPVIFDWQESQLQSLARRVELRRQKWTIKQRELEYLAAKQLNRWRVDLVGEYGFKGFGDNLFGSRDRTNGSAFADLLSGDLDDWQLGVEINGAIGNRQGHLAIRNAELNLTREKAILKEQQRQILHDLGAAFVEVDRSFSVMKSTVNNRIAVQEELEPKQKRVEAGQDQVFFLLDAQQRAATAESAVHRAIKDYNQALLNYVFTTGSLLARYNVFLTEGPWEDGAYARAKKKAERLDVVDGNFFNSDNGPVTNEPYPQQLPSVGYSVPTSVTTGPTQSIPVVPFANEPREPEDLPEVDEDFEDDSLDDDFDDNILEGQELLETIDDQAKASGESGGSVRSEFNRQSRIVERASRTAIANPVPSVPLLRASPSTAPKLGEAAGTTVTMSPVQNDESNSYLNRASFVDEINSKEKSKIELMNFSEAITPPTRIQSLPTVRRLQKPEPAPAKEIPSVGAKVANRKGLLTPNRDLQLKLPGGSVTNAKNIEAFKAPKKLILGSNSRLK